MLEQYRVNIGLRITKKEREELSAKCATSLISTVYLWSVACKGLCSRHRYDRF